LVKQFSPLHFIASSHKDRPHYHISELMVSIV
jgi:hypothetical protein